MPGERESGTDGSGAAPSPIARGSRVLVLSALTIAVVLVGVVLLSGRSPYRVTAVIQDASQLVRGNLVEVGGVKIGTVKTIKLNDQGQAELLLDITDGSFSPLHQGTAAQVRVSSLSSISSRYVQLQAGPDNAPKIPNNGTIPIQNTQPAVDLDQLLNTLDAQTRAGLQDIIHGSATTLQGQTHNLNAGLRELNPALSETAKTVNELNTDETSFERFIVAGASVVNAVASRDTNLDHGLAQAATVTNTLAGRTQAIGQILSEAPPALAQADTTLAALRSTLTQVGPAVRLLLPVAPRLNTFITNVDPVARRAVPVLAGVDTLLPELGAALQTLPSLDAAARPAFSATVKAISAGQPILNGTLPDVPDITHGLLEGFGGTAAGYYDANGEYARISPVLNNLSATGLGGLLNGVVNGTLKTGQTSRCPGAAQQSVPDNSNPFVSPALPCDPSQIP